MGTGGVGGYFGGLLARAGHEVKFVARGAHLDAINASGLHIESSNKGDFTVQCEATQAPNSSDIPELILFSVKMFQNEDAMDVIEPSVGPNTIILSIQNGVDNGEILSKRFSYENVMIGSAFVEGRIKCPGTVTQGGPGIAAFGEQFIGLSDRANMLNEIFKDAAWDVELHENMEGVLWKKFAYLVASASICSASHSDYGTMRSNPETRTLIIQGISEVLNVGKALGKPIMEDSVQWAENSLDRFPATGKASMAKDFLEGKPVELEGLTGRVVALGSELGVPTPVCSTLYAILKPWALQNSL
tara:strand:- start:14021 stop:14926 length:906 start_codon:yes stop_codon:yes gene_type:complete